MGGGAYAQFCTTTVGDDTGAYVLGVGGKESWNLGPTGIGEGISGVDRCDMVDMGGNIGDKAR